MTTQQANIDNRGTDYNVIHGYDYDYSLQSSRTTEPPGGESIRAKSGEGGAVI
jgi:hypothetical protein